MPTNQKLLSILVLVVILLVPAASAYDRITQGSAVYLNETYDISGVTGWAEQLAWYGKYAEYTEPQKIIDLPGLQHTSPTSQYYYWISPGVFGNYPGKWYQYYDNQSETNGNLLAFTIETWKPFWVNSTTYIIPSNTTVVNTTPVLPLPQRYVADYLIARGDRFNITVTNNTNVWLFGRINGVYNHQSTGDAIVINESLITGFETGPYTILLQTMKDPFGYFTVKYDEENNAIEYFDSGSFTVNKLPLVGYSPQVILEKLKGIFPKVKDSFSLYKLEIENPSVLIMSVDEIYNNGSSILDVKGYTNVAPGTPIKIVLDEDRQTPQSIMQFTYTGKTIGAFDGNMRQFEIYVPINWDNMAATGGQVSIHEFHVTTALGGESYYDLPVFTMPADSYKPNATIKYISDRNPWIPTPTPEIVEKIIPGPVVTVVITIPVTPSNEQVKAQQKIIMDKINGDNWAKAALIIVGVVILAVVYLVLRYLTRVYRRVKK